MARNDNMRVTCNVVSILTVFVSRRNKITAGKMRNTSSMFNPVLKNPSADNINPIPPEEFNPLKRSIIMRNPNAMMIMEVSIISFTSFMFTIIVLSPTAPENPLRSLHYLTISRI